MRPLVTTAMKNATLGQTKKTTASFAPAVVPRRRRCHGEKVSKGYTLLELLLALSLTGLVIALIFGTINVYVFQAAKQQERLEQELVSRSVLKIMASDIRAALESRPIQHSGINAFLESASLAKGVASRRFTSVQEKMAGNPSASLFGLINPSFQNRFLLCRELFKIGFGFGLMPNA